MPRRCRDCVPRSACGRRVGDQFRCRDCGRLFRRCWTLRAHRGRARQRALQVLADWQRHVSERRLVPCPDDLHLLRVCRLAGLAHPAPYAYERCRLVERLYIPDWAEASYWSLRARGLSRPAAVELLMRGPEHPVVVQSLALPVE